MQTPALPFGMLPFHAYLRWLYLARLTLASGIFAAALLVWTQPQIAPETTLIATLMLVLTLGFTAGSFSYTHMAQQRPTTNFLYAQALFDVLLVTAVVHLTGRGESAFAPLYVLVIAEGAVLLPLRGGFLVGALATLMYFADAVWGGMLTEILGGVRGPEQLDFSVLVRTILFAVIALVTAWLGERVRRAGTQLGDIESRLRQLQLDTDDILGTLATGVITVDDAGTLSYMNPAAEHLLGMLSGEWVGEPAMDAMERVVPGLAQVVERTLETGRAVEWYETHTRALPDIRVLGVRSMALERGERPWVTVMLQDITDGKRAEGLIRRAERLEAIAELAASLAHEIKNPLASIRSAVEQLARPHARLGKADRGTLETLVLGESDRLSRLLSGFIEFSRVELQERSRFEVGEVVRAAIEVALQHPDAAPTAGVQLDAAEPVEIEGDPDLLHRVAFNLVLNALQHSPPGGRVRVAVRPAEASDVPAGSELAGSGLTDLEAGAGAGTGARISVSDDGPGIRPEHLARVFDPFFTTREGGSGLGLALVHRAVEAHDGAVFVDGNSGAGTTFTVYIPSTLPQVAQ